MVLKDLFKLVNNYLVGKTMKNVRNDIDIKLLTIDHRRK